MTSILIKLFKLRQKLYLCQKFGLPLRLFRRQLKWEFRESRKLFPQL